ncbi:C-glycoside deglycosidase beta subunit domain-containing protein [Geodermatophilus sp. FMUSA9-8]|uniref:C-glycoside deglycosidase beta subunit domain-containing protein n=1 Tax=Geodermatophilus sp. FMUSA9-8 TaxID=3120155 RepID=UPI003009AE5B
MLDRNVIQGRGFRNVVEDGRVTGFQLVLRNPNYRGVAASLLDGVEVTVDGETVPDSVPLWTLQGRTYTLDELRATTDVRWQLDEPATITVPRPGGLAPGVHDVRVVVYLRRPYFPPMVSRTTFTAEAKAVVVPPAPEGGLRFGVSTYSYSGDVYTLMTLEDVLADVADLGATGIEILGEGNVPGYPSPDAAWIDTWHGLLARYGLTATNYGSWVDTEMWSDRALTAEEAAAQLQLDLRLAHRLGFTSVRPKFGVTSWQLDPHPVWEEAVLRSLDLAADLDVVICPEIHAPTPIRHPVTQGYLDLIERTGSKHFKLLIDTGIFNTAPVLDLSEEIGAGDGGDVPEHLRPLAVPMADLVEVLPHVHFIQAKFAEVDDDLRDLHVPWEQIVPTLQEHGWSGWLSSEYEGRREPYRGADQVRRQHALLRTLAAR